MSLDDCCEPKKEKKEKKNTEVKRFLKVSISK